MDEVGARGQLEVNLLAPLALVVRAGQSGDADVAVPWSDWAGLPEGVVRELTAEHGGREVELRGDGFAVALVHLATVGFDINARHDG